MTNGEKLLQDDSWWIAIRIAENVRACEYCAYRGGCEEDQPYYERTCSEGVLEWLEAEAV